MYHRDIEVRPICDRAVIKIKSDIFVAKNKSLFSHKYKLSNTTNYCKMVFYDDEYIVWTYTTLTTKSSHLNYEVTNYGRVILRIFNHEDGLTTRRLYRDAGYRLTDLTIKCIRVEPPILDRMRLHRSPRDVEYFEDVIAFLEEYQESVDSVFNEDFGFLNGFVRELAALDHESPEQVMRVQREVELIADHFKSMKDELAAAREEIAALKSAHAKDERNLIELKDAILNVLHKKMA